MARALMGHIGSTNEHMLAYEVTRLRRRVAELEGELAELRAQRTETLDSGELDLRDLELHNLTGAVEPVLA